MFPIYVNQAGYFPNQKKMAVMTEDCPSFQVKDMQGNVRFEGTWTCFGEDTLSGDTVFQGDFSALTIPGRYVIETEKGVSATFEIGEKAYDKLMYDLMRGFYFLRCGCALEEKHAGKFTHAPCHTDKASEWEHHDVKKQVLGGWHDAGDYGRYVTPGAVALCHLLYAFHFYKDVFEKQYLNIPESGNQLPDLLNECKWELDWLLQMQREDGAVYHKLTTAQHAPFVMPEEDRADLFLLPVTTVASADFAAICALASRIYRPYDSNYSDKLFRAAEKTYQWLVENPWFLPTQNPKGCSTGGYYERDDLSNRFWAAAEMYAATGDASYYNQMKRLQKMPFPPLALGWGEVGGFGALAVITSEFSVEEDVLADITKGIIQQAEKLAETANQSGYKAAMEEMHYCWGSNMILMMHGMMFALADHLEGKNRFRVYVQMQLDVLMGVNAMGISYVTGNGDYAYNNPHLRPAYADGIEECIPGMVSGGPNRRPGDAVAREMVLPGTPPMKSYIDHWGSYSMNEITIYWNSPAVFVLAALMAK